MVVVALMVVVDAAVAVAVLPPVLELAD
jgi:hypothetical protein